MHSISLIKGLFTVKYYLHLQERRLYTICRPGQHGEGVVAGTQQGNFKRRLGLIRRKLEK